jgi:acetyl esterase/lipase
MTVPLTSRGRLRPAISVALTVAALSMVACSARQPRPIPAVEITRDVTYAERGDRELRADIYRPTDGGVHPGILVVHGGGWRHGSKWHMARIARRLAENGYVAVSIDYRLAPRHRFPAQVHDCKEAVRWMRRNAAKLGIDPEHIGGFGYSAGGHLVSMLATTDEDDGFEGGGTAGGPPTRIEAAVAGAPPTDLRRFVYNPVFYSFLGGSKTALPATYAVASPITFVTSDDPPMFFYHGRHDWMVDVSQSQTMVSSLQSAGVPVEYHEGGGGHFTTFLFDNAAVDDAVAFLDRWLKEPASQIAATAK